MKDTIYGYCIQIIRFVLLGNWDRLQAMKCLQSRICLRFLYNIYILYLYKWEECNNATKSWQGHSPSAATETQCIQVAMISSPQCRSHPSIIFFIQVFLRCLNKYIYIIIHIYNSRILYLSMDLNNVKFTDETNLWKEYSTIDRANQIVQRPGINIYNIIHKLRTYIS